MARDPKSVLVFKIPYTRKLKHLGLRNQLMRLLAEIRQYYGQGFLADTKQSSWLIQWFGIIF